MRPPNDSPPIAGGATDAMTVEQAEMVPDDLAARARALRTGMTIAAAIGLHNFAEGLAIGVSASTGEIGLATVLIIGFAVHNATEGFGIIGPLGERRPTWTWLGVAGLVGGAPVFLGAMLGYEVDLGAARASLLLGLRRRDPLCDRRGLDRDAPPGPPRAGPADAGRRPLPRHGDRDGHRVRRRLEPLSGAQAPHLESVVGCAS